MTDLDSKRRDPLDVALGKLPHEIAPSAELWSRISDDITAPVSVEAARASQVAMHSGASRRWLQVAAGVLLMVGSSFATWVVVQRSFDERIRQVQQATVQQMQPVLNAMPVSFGMQQTMGAEYTKARTELSREFERRVLLLPPVTRAKLERNLADLRRAANEISTTLGQHPSDPLLQQLLLSTYQSELALLGSVTDVTTPALGANL